MLLLFLSKVKGQSSVKDMQEAKDCFNVKYDKE